MIFLLTIESMDQKKLLSLILLMYLFNRKKMHKILTVFQQVITELHNSDFMDHSLVQ